MTKEELNIKEQIAGKIMSVSIYNASAFTVLVLVLLVVIFFQYKEYKDYRNVADTKYLEITDQLDDMERDIEDIKRILNK